LLTQQGKELDSDAAAAVKYEQFCRYQVRLLVSSTQLTNHTLTRFHPLKSADHTLTHASHMTHAFSQQSIASLSRSLDAIGGERAAEQQETNEALLRLHLASEYKDWSHKYRWASGVLPREPRENAELEPGWMYTMM
jgi:hypothetical protein